MGKKRRRKGRGSGQSNEDDKDLAHRPFAAALGDRRRAVADQERQRATRALEHKKDAARKVARADGEGRPVVARKEAMTGQSVEMTEAELFEAALRDIDPQKIVSGKYHGLGPDTANVRVKEERRLSPAEIEELAPPSDPYHDELALFEEAMGLADVKPVGSNLHSTDEIVREVESDRSLVRQRPGRMDRVARQEAIEAVLVNAGPNLRPGQKQLVRAASKFERSRVLPEVNVRGDTKEVALRRIELTCLQAAASGDRFVRVITGKGRGSEAEPVLKETLVSWCLGDGEGVVVEYAPEVQPDGTFGSFVLQVRRSRRR